MSLVQDSRLEGAGCVQSLTPWRITLLDEQILDVGSKLHGLRVYGSWIVERPILARLVLEKSLNPSFIISSVLGLTAGWLVSRRTRKADVETASLSIAPKPQSPLSGRLYAIPPEQWASLAPEMIAALWRVGEIAPEAMPGLAADLLLRGFDGKWLRRCAGEIHPVRADIDEFAYLLFQELGVRKIFDEDQARDMIGLFIAKEVCESRIDPFDGVARIETLFDWELPSNCRFQGLIAPSIRYGYEIAENEENIKQNIRDACFELIRGHE